MSINQSGYIGSLQADSFHDKQDLIYKDKQINKAKDDLIAHQNINANLGQNNQILLDNNLRLEREKNSYKEQLARPLMEILDENADLKKALEEQKQLMGLWMLSQSSFKKIALDLGKQKGLTEQEIKKKSEENMNNILNGSTLDGVVTESSMVYFEKYKTQLIKKINTK